MEKSAQKKTYRDPILNRIVQEKAAWNREVSAFINDVIHFKKSMNGWPSKFYKERTRLSQPIPIDLASILSKMTGEFQELANQGNGLIQEQKEFAQAYVKRHSERAQDKLEQTHGPATPAAPSPARPDLSQQMGKKLSASNLELVKLASEMEFKYELEVLASNPFSRFITRLFNPKFGFTQASRIRRLRMTMLDYCVKSYKELKKLHKEVVKSNKNSIEVSHKMMTVVWNYWNAVNRLFTTFKVIRPEEIVDEGGEISDPARKKEKSESAKPAGAQPALQQDSAAIAKLKDFQAAFNQLGSLMSNQSFNDLHSIVESVNAATNDRKLEVLQNANVEEVYAKALKEANQELGTTGSSFQEVAVQMQSQPAKTAQLQRYLGKTRHQILPGMSSGQRLEIYNLITQIRRDLDNVMNLLEKGFDQEQLTTAIGQVNREMVTLRTMMRSLYSAEKPEVASSPFF
jgi:hypothetical protein